MRAGLVLLLSVGLLSCANTGALHLRTEADDITVFDRYRSYAIAPPPESASSLPEYSEITGRMFSEKIAERLEQTGLEPADWEEADLQVALTVNGQARIDVWDWHHSWVAGSTGSVRMLRGSLQVDIYDREAQRVVWNGLAWQETMDDSLGDERGLRAVDKLMARYPKGDAFR